MLKRIPSAMLVLLPLAGCSGNSFIHPRSEQFTVDSVPVGASVLVLGEAVGQTPMSLTTRQVFPHSFARDKQHLYGRVEITYPGCEPFMTTVSSRVINEGIRATLNCEGEQAEVNGGPGATPPQTPPTTAAPLRQRLRRLKELFEEGLISEADYAEKRKQLLEEL